MTGLLTGDAIRYIACVWYGCWSILALWCTIADKRRAKRHMWRIPEAWLLAVGAMGGAPVMLCCMLLIRHKTRHGKFMLTLPLFTILHLGAILWILQKQTMVLL